MSKRRAALIISIIWALFWVALGLGTSILKELNLAGYVLNILFPGIFFIISVIIAYFNKIIGGFLLIFESIFIIVAYFLISYENMPILALLSFLVLMVLPPFISGIMFVLSWIEDNR